MKDRRRRLLLLPRRGPRRIRPRWANIHALAGANCLIANYPSLIAYRPRVKSICKAYKSRHEFAYLSFALSFFLHFFSVFFSPFHLFLQLLLSYARWMDMCSRVALHSGYPMFDSRRVIISLFYDLFHLSSFRVVATRPRGGGRTEIGVISRRARRSSTFDETRESELRDLLAQRSIVQGLFHHICVWSREINARPNYTVPDSASFPVCDLSPSRLILLD